MRARLAGVVTLGLLALAVACGTTSETTTGLLPPSDTATKAPAAPEPDAGGPAPGDGGADAAVCPPPSVDPARFIVQRPAKAKPAMCVNQAMLEGTVDACVRGTTSCGTWLDAPENLDCDECLLTVVTDTVWGPIVFLDKQRLFVNKGGAAALAGATQACADAVHKVEACALEACTCKPGSTVCDGKARTGPCKAFVTARDTACASAADKAIVAVTPADYAFFAPFCPP